MSHVNVNTLPPSKAYSLGGFVKRANALLDESATALKLYGKLSDQPKHKEVRTLEHVRWIRC